MVYAVLLEIVPSAKGQEMESVAKSPTELA